jgi:hypothetical protein
VGVNAPPICENNRFFLKFQSSNFLGLRRSLYVRITYHNTSQEKKRRSTCTPSRVSSPHRSTLPFTICANLLVVRQGTGRWTHRLRALIIRHVACSRAGKVTATSSHFGAHGPGPAGNRVTLHLSPLSTDEGKAEASFPLPPKKVSKFSARKNLQNSPLRKKN